KKQLNIKSALIFLIGLVPGAILGAIASRQLATDLFMLYFGIFMLIVATSLFIQPKMKRTVVSEKSFMREGIDDLGKPYVYGFSITSAILVSIGVGFLSSLFGVGGGALMVPVMIVWFGFPAKIAAATAMLVVLFSAIVGTSAHFVAGHIHWWYVLALLPGAWFGGRAGAWLNKRMDSKMLIIVMRIVFIGLALQFIYQGIV
uniref:sulfite exporter TauE/SafE family protein n=1 Tax=Bacillus sp. JCM 19041 TaxID=1460637 RepID=UPI0006D28748